MPSREGRESFDRHHIPLYSISGSRPPRLEPDNLARRSDQPSPLQAELRSIISERIWGGFGAVSRAVLIKSGLVQQL